MHANVLDLIGNTPIVDVSNLSPNPNVRILAKLEMQNPFGSVKDRIAKSMIEAAEKDGRLLPGQTILEPSSGNTGIALAAIARLKGYPIKILLPESVSIERRQMLEIMGAEVILTPGEEGSNGAVRRAQQLADEHPEWCFIYQYGNDANPRAHYEGTGPEIWRDVPEITHFVAGLGTVRHADGHRALPQGAEPRRSRSSPSSRRSASGSRVCATWTRATSRRCSRTGTASSCSTASASCVPASRSSGRGVWSTSAACSPASRRARRWPAPPRSPSEIDEGTIVFIVCDGGWKYLSTGAYTADLDEAEANAEKIIYF